MTDSYITERQGVKGISYLVRIREQGISIAKTFKDKKEAINFVYETKSKIIKGTSVDITKIKKLTLKEIFEDYIKHNTISKNKKYTLELLANEIGKVTLSHFKSGIFALYLKTKLEQDLPEQKKTKKKTKLYDGYMIEKDGELVRKKYSESTIRKYYYAIKTALQWHAKHYDYTFDRKPFDENKAPRAWSNIYDRIVSEEELEKLLNACDKMYVKQAELKAFIKFQYFSAMRSNESLLLKWSDIHIDEQEPYNSYIHVPKENQKTKDKKKSENRKIPLRPAFYDFVKNELFKLKKDNQKLVFGDYWKTSSIVAQRFKIVAKNAELRDIKIHAFRHTACTWYFVNTNLTQIEISKITGHIELETLKRYLNLRSSDIGRKLWS